MDLTSAKRALVFVNGHRLQFGVPALLIALSLSFNYGFELGEKSVLSADGRSEDELRQQLKRIRDEQVKSEDVVVVVFHMIITKYLLSALPSTKEALTRHLRATPTVDCAFVAKNSTIIGNVECQQDSSVWYNAVLRADINSITIGRGSNVQDSAVIHVTRKYPTVVGNGVSIGHGAILHGCTIGDGCLVGMGAIILDGCSVGGNSLIAAGSVLSPGKKFPSDSLIIGSPAVVKRRLTETELFELKDNSDRYVIYAQEHARSNKH